MNRRQFLASALFARGSLSQGNPSALAGATCDLSECRFDGVEITVQVVDAAIRRPLREAQQRFEEAYGGVVHLILDPIDTATDIFVEDIRNGIGKFDGAVVAAPRLGELVGAGAILPLDGLVSTVSDPSDVPLVEDEFLALRPLRRFGGQSYTMPFDGDTLLLYFRRDLVTADGALGPPGTPAPAMPSTAFHWEGVLQAATAAQERFGVKGMSLAVTSGGQAPEILTAIMAPFVLGPENPDRFWFEPETMEPLIDSPGHVAGFDLYRALIDTASAGGRDRSDADAWDRFLAGEALFTIGGADLLAFGVERGSPVLEMIGVSPLPVARSYTDPIIGMAFDSEGANIVGNSAGPSWAGAISRLSAAPEATFAFFALLLNEDRQRLYAARPSDGIAPWRWSQIPAAAAARGTGEIEDYTSLGWPEPAVLSWSSAVATSLNASIQLPTLRIAAVPAYRAALDRHLALALQEPSRPSAEVLTAVAADWRQITRQQGLDKQSALMEGSAAV